MIKGWALAFVSDPEFLDNSRYGYNEQPLCLAGDLELDYSEAIRRKYYYAMYEWNVWGRCSCFGHATRCKPKSKNEVTNMEKVRFWSFPIADIRRASIGVPEDSALPSIRVAHGSLTSFNFLNRCSEEIKVLIPVNRIGVMLQNSEQPNFSTRAKKNDLLKMDGSNLIKTRLQFVSV